METCSDCLYYEVCQNRYSWLDQEDNTKHITCEKFKNKADFVEIVRCKDCIYWENGKSYTPYCNNFGSMLEDTKADDFCCFGEKRSDT